MTPNFDLQAYLERIDFRGRPAADLATLKRLHRAHVEAIPYENLDVQFARPASRDPGAVAEKIVGRRRGGWCYEMNGLLGAALDAIGFDVRRVAGGVMREKMGDAVVGNHLVLLVDLGEIYVADAGFGDGLIEPVEARPGDFAVGPFNGSIRDAGGGWLRVAFDNGDATSSYDINPEVDDDALLETHCRDLQTSPDSPFVLNAVVQRWQDDVHYSMRGRVLTSIAAGGRTKTLIKDADDYVATLKRVFALEIPEAARLWPKITARHEALFGAAAV